MSVEYAERYPVATFASGPTNSMRGAAFLSGLDDCAVVDIGGTTTDVGVLAHGFPREASVAVDIGGVRTNFRMPDVLLVRPRRRQPGRRGPRRRSGPHSVGYELTAAGARLRRRHADRDRHRRRRRAWPRSATRERVARPRPRAGRARRSTAIAGAIAEVVDRMKTSADADPGGRRRRRQRSCSRDRSPGASELVKPRALRGRERDRRGDRPGRRRGRPRLLARRAHAATRRSTTPRQRGERQGGRARAPARRRVRIVDVEEVPLAYLPGNATRIRVKAVGDLELAEGDRCGEFTEADLRRPRASAPPILGTGGGGNPYIGKLLARAAIREHGPVTLVDVDEVPDDALVVPSAMMGAPTVMVEKLPRGDEIAAARSRRCRAVPRPADHAHDADRGRRAELDDAVHRRRAARDPAGRRRRDGPRVPRAADGHARRSTASRRRRWRSPTRRATACVIDRTVDNRWTERLARSVTVDMGSTRR